MDHTILMPLESDEKVLMLSDSDIDTDHKAVRLTLALRGVTSDTFADLNPAELSNLITQLQHLQRIDRLLRNSGKRGKRPPA